MAVEKTLVKARIKALFPNTNLTTQRLDAIAAKLAEKLEDGADNDAIDAVINEFNENSYMTIEEIARNDDRIRNLAKKAGTPPTERKPEVKSDESDDDDPTSLLLKELKSLKEDISSLKAENQQKSIADRFKSDERLKGIPAAMLKGRIPKTEDEIESSIEELVSDWAEISGSVEDTNQKERLGRFGKDVPPAAGGKGSDFQVSEKEAEEIAKLLV